MAGRNSVPGTNPTKQPNPRHGQYNESGSYFSGTPTGATQNRDRAADGSQNYRERMKKSAALGREAAAQAKTQYNRTIPMSPKGR